MSNPMRYSSMVFYTIFLNIVWGITIYAFPFSTLGVLLEPIEQHASHELTGLIMVSAGLAALIGLGIRNKAPALANILFIPMHFVIALIGTGALVYMIGLSSVRNTMVLTVFITSVFYFFAVNYHWGSSKSWLRKRLNGK